MKKTAKLLTLAVALFAGFAGTAQAEGFKVGADVVSSYVWRGGDLGDSAAIQPALSYTFEGGNVIVGAWGSYAVSDQNGNARYKETDLYATVLAGPFNLTVTDYYVPTGTNTRAFNFKKDGPNVVEVSAGYAKDELSLLAAINVAGTENGNAKYFEAGYKFYDKDGYSAKGVAGIGNRRSYGNTAQEDKVVFVNTGISVSKDRYTASYVYNPDTEKSNIIFMASF